MEAELEALEARPTPAPRPSPRAELMKIYRPLRPGRPPNRRLFISSSIFISIILGPGSRCDTGNKGNKHVCVRLGSNIGPLIPISDHKG